jgi:hypothetical protein
METLGDLIYGKNKDGYAEWLKKEISWAEAITLRNFHRAMTDEGDYAMRIIWEMLEGKPMQKMAGAEGGAIQFERKDEVFDLKKLTLDELREFRRLTIKAKSEKGGGITAGRIGG